MDSGVGYTVRDLPAPTWTRSGTWSEAAIPPRPWVAPGYFLRGAVTLLIGAGGISKSTLVLGYAVALAIGRQFHGMQPVRPMKVAVFNVEDDGDEQERRLSAVLTSVGKTPDDIDGLILRTGPTRTGTLFERDPVTGGIIATPALAKLERDLIEFGADVLFVDPLAELHGIEENDNTGMRAIVAEFRTLAGRCSLSLGIVHHTRKGPAIAGDAEAGRGASSVVGAARIVLTLTGMAAEDAEAMGLAPAAAKSFFRIDGGKSNYASLTECEWFQRVAYTLANGDHVAVAVPWTPPADVVSVDTRVSLEGAVAAGSPLGPWSAKLSSDARSIRHLLVQHGIQTATGQRAAITALHSAGFVQAEFRKPGNRAMAQGLRSPDGLPTGVAWTDADAR